MNLRKICIFAVIFVLLCRSFPLVLMAEDAENRPPDFTTPRMNNAEAVEKLVELATKYNTVYVNGTVGQPLSCDLIENTINSTSGDGNKDRAERNKKAFHITTTPSIVPEWSKRCFYGIGTTANMTIMKMKR